MTSNPDPANPAEATRPAKQALALALALAAAPAHGLDWSFKAFGTLAGAGTDTDKIALVRDYSQNKGATDNWTMDVDSRLGLQVDLDINEQFHAMAQWVARNHTGNFIEQNLDWAFLRWRPRSDLDIRLGRLGLDAFFMSEYRNVGYAYLWMRPPQEFYGIITFYNFNGIDIAKKFRVGEGLLTLKGYAGQQSQSSIDFLQFDNLLFGANLAYELGNWRVRLGYFQLQDLKNPEAQNYLNLVGSSELKHLWPGAQASINFLRSPGKRLHYSSLGVAYDNGVWPVQAEVSYIESGWIETPSLVNGYLSVGRRFGPLTPYALFGFETSLGQRMDIPEPPPQNAALLGNLQNRLEIAINPSVNQLSVSLGARWDVHENIALKAEWSHYWLNGNIPWPWLPVSSGPIPEQVNAWSFGVDFMY